MSYIVIWGYKTGLTNKKFIGIKPCECCHRFSEQYLSKSFFRINLFWFIPIFGVPTGKYLRCTKCDSVIKLTRDQWRELKEKARYMPKKKQYLQAYEELKTLVLVSEPDDLTVSTIYNRLLSKLDFTDDGGHIRELVEVYLENSQNVANMLGKTEDTASAQTSDALTAPVETTPAETSVSGDTTEPASKSVAAQPTTAAPHLVYETESEAPKKRSKARLLWLIPALLLLPLALLLAFAGISVVIDDPSDMAANIFMILLFVLLPLGLDFLFFSLALKKK